MNKIILFLLFDIEAYGMQIWVIGTTKDPNVTMAWQL